MRCGQGETAVQIGGRASAETIQSKVVPGLLEAIKDGPSYQFSESIMLAMAKIGGEENRTKFEFILNWFLSTENSAAEMNHVAPVALGVLSDIGGYEVLAGLAKDDERGRERPVDARLSSLEFEGRPATAITVRDQRAGVDALARARAQPARGPRTRSGARARRRAGGPGSGVERCASGWTAGDRASGARNNVTHSIGCVTLPPLENPGPGPRCGDRR